MKREMFWMVVVSVAVGVAAYSTGRSSLTNAAPLPVAVDETAHDRKPEKAGPERDEYTLSRTGGIIAIAPADGCAGNDREATLRRLVAEQVVLLRHDGLYIKVLQSETAYLRKSRVFKDLEGDTGKMIQWLEQNLQVHAIPGTAFIEVSVHPGSYDSEAHAIVKEIVTQHIQDCSERAFLGGAHEAQGLKALQTHYRLEFQENELKYLKLLAEIPSDEEKSVHEYRKEVAKKRVDGTRSQLREIDDKSSALEARMNQKLVGDVTWVMMPEPPPTARAKP